MTTSPTQRTTDSLCSVMTFLQKSCVLIGRFNCILISPKILRNVTIVNSKMVLVTSVYSLQLKVTAKASEA